jgi:type II secretory ATPase GspE/PulE/Tfp pilus assembly ATPase PilB-like protein
MFWDKFLGGKGDSKSEKGKEKSPAPGKKGAPEEFGAKPARRTQGKTGKPTATAPANKPRLELKEAPPPQLPALATKENAPESMQLTPMRTSRTPIIEANDEQIKEILAFRGRVLTAPGGPIETSSAQRTLIAILDNGVVICSKDDPMNAHVMAVKSVAKRQGVQFRYERYTDLDVIRKVYEAAEGRDNANGTRQADSAQMQKEFIELVRAASETGASDIHIIVERFEAILRFRINGVMKTIRQIPAARAADMLQAAFNMADASDPSYKPYDYQGARVSELNAPLPEEVQAVRLQFNPLAGGGRYMIARLLYKKSSVPGQDIDTLGYSPIHIRQIKQMRKMPYGINIISGPTGSGKSTTLQRALSALMEEKKFEVNVITIEDPPEYVITGAAQLPVTNAQTDEERNEKFRQAISASLRSDPDIIMIGEIRDRASSALAFAAAMTGHQVWASLHANDAISILDRFRDQHVEVYKLTDHTLVTGLVGQRLVRRLCDHCKLPLDMVVEYEDERIIHKDFVNDLRYAFGEDMFSRICIANENGCEHCNSGYQGRNVVAEVILPDLGFMNLIRDGKKEEALKYWLDHLDGMTMLEHSMQKILEGLADPRDVEGKIGVFAQFDITRRKKIFEMIGIEVADVPAAQPDEVAQLEHHGETEE